jgi:hypothetical protein
MVIKLWKRWKMENRKIAKIVRKAILESKVGETRRISGERTNPADVIGWVYLDDYVVDDAAFRKLQGIFSKLGYYLGNATTEAGEDDSDYAIIYVASRKLSRNELRALVRGEEAVADILGYFILEDYTLDDVAFEELERIVSRIGYYLGDVAAEMGMDVEGTIVYVARRQLSRAELEKYFEI